MLRQRIRYDLRTSAVEPLKRVVNTIIMRKNEAKLNRG